MVLTKQVVSRRTNGPDCGCMARHAGPLCATCKNGWNEEHTMLTPSIKIKDECVECLQTQLTWVFQLVVLYSCMGCFVATQSRKLDVDESGAATSIILFFFQSLFLLAKASQGSQFFGLFEILNMDPTELAAGAKECKINADYHRNFVIKTIITPAWLLVCAMGFLELEQWALDKWVPEGSHYAEDGQLLDEHGKPRGGIWVQDVN